MSMRRFVCVLILVLGVASSSRGAETNLVFSRDFLSEMLRHLYRWHLDETALLAIDDAAELEILARPLKPTLDAGDLSRYAELAIPRLSLLVTLKQADYSVPDMNLRITNSGFRLLRVERYESLPRASNAYETIRLPRKETLEHLFATRNRHEYPDAELRERLRRALRKQLVAPGGPPPTAQQTFYVAPISPVANDLWAFWETGGKLIRFSSDADLKSKAYWEYEELGVRVYDLQSSVVVSLAEVPGSNAFATRDWAARVLFNCVVFGQRLTVVPEDDLNRSMNVRESPARQPPEAK